MIIPIGETTKVEPLFAGWHDTLIRSCMQGIMGEIYAEDVKEPRSAFALLGDFCLLAGEPSKDLLRFQKQIGPWSSRILVPSTEPWAELIRETYGQSIHECTRYALKKTANFDQEKLKSAVLALDTRFRLLEIDEVLYHVLLADPWSKDLVGQFPTYERFRDLALGFVVMEDQRVVSGASTYCRYHGGIEIEVDTRESYRRKGLAYSCSAKLIDAALQRGLFPSWDAHTEASLQLALKLGYELDYPYQCFTRA
ncbi:MAG: GNAT family N-acetyltransferase [Sphaerochaeta sp.]